MNEGPAMTYGQGHRLELLLRLAVAQNIQLLAALLELEVAIVQPAAQADLYRRLKAHLDAQVDVARKVLERVSAEAVAEHRELAEGENELLDALKKAPLGFQPPEEPKRKPSGRRR